jgi:hypothetical protein
MFGRDDAAQRWHDGDHGPDATMARSTKRVCRDCGFMVPLAGALGAMFGVCCNALSADGQVVDYFYGCGAHSDTPTPAGTGSPLYEPFDDGVLDVVEVRSVILADVVVEVEAAVVEVTADVVEDEADVVEGDRGVEVDTVVEEPGAVIEPAAVVDDQSATEVEPDTSEVEPASEAGPDPQG